MSRRSRRVELATHLGAGSLGRAGAADGGGGARGRRRTVGVEWGIWRGREGGHSARGIGGVGGGLAMAHLPLVRHKYDDSDGAPPPGAPLEFCFNY